MKETSRKLKQIYMMTDDRHFEKQQNFEKKFFF